VAGPGAGDEPACGSATAALGWTEGSAAQENCCSKPGRASNRCTSGSSAAAQHGCHASAATKDCSCTQACSCSWRTEASCAFSTAARHRACVRQHRQQQDSHLPGSSIHHSSCKPHTWCLHSGCCTCQCHCTQRGPCSSHHHSTICCSTACASSAQCNSTQQDCPPGTSSHSAGYSGAAAAAAGLRATCRLTHQGCCPRSGCRFLCRQAGQQVQAGGSGRRQRCPATAGGYRRWECRCAPWQGTSGGLLGQLAEGHCGQLVLQVLVVLLVKNGAGMVLHR
jgi:hypothetical protein